MKYLALSMLLTFNVAACDWSSIKESNGSFVYPAECHKEVGKALAERKLLKQENQELKKAIEFKDLAINEANIRAEDYRKVAVDTNDRMHSMSERGQIKDILTFAGGLALGIISAKVAVEVLK